MTTPAAPYLDLFFTDSPYKDFPLDDYPEYLDGWHSEHPLFEKLIRQHQPKLMIEVGTWLGHSALTCAQILQQLELETPVICIDTWLGAQEFWKDIHHNRRYKDLALKSGYPGVFYQFVANVLHRGHDSRIVPLPQTSTIAARLLSHHLLQAELIYIDGSHDEGDVLADLEAYWPLLREGGSLFGDDYDEYWPGLILDVEHFGEQKGLKVERNGGFWCIHKPARSDADAAPAKSPFQKMDVSEATALRVENALLSSRLMSLESQSDYALGEKEKAIRDLLKQLEEAYTKAAQMEHSAGFFAADRDRLKTELEELKRRKA